MHLIIDQQFREIVNDRLAERGWTRTDLAERMGVPRTTVTDYLNGRRHPGPEMIEKFFAALDLRPKLVAEETRESATVVD